MHEDPKQPLSLNLPTPEAIRSRLTAIYREAAMLRRLLRVAEQRAAMQAEERASDDQ